MVEIVKLYEMFDGTMYKNIDNAIGYNKDNAIVAYALKVSDTEYIYIGNEQSTLYIIDDENTWE